MKKIFFLIVCFFTSFLVFANNDADWRKLLDERIIGVWDYNPVPYDIVRSKTFSWGQGLYVVSESIMIDYGLIGQENKETPQLRSDITYYEVTNTVQIDTNTFKVSLFSVHFETSCDLIIHFVDNNQIWFETDEQYNGVDESSLEFSLGERAYGYGDVLTGQNKMYYRISGPDFIQKYGIANNNLVRIRTEPNLDSDTVGHLNKSDAIAILEKTEVPMKIGDMESVWYKIRTEAGLEGWSYGYFIDPISEAK